MASNKTRRSGKKTGEGEQRPTQSGHLRVIPGGKSAAAINELLSGRVSRRPRAPTRRKREIPPQELPKQIEKTSNLFAAARTLRHEIETKENWARSKLDEFCIREFCHRFVVSERRPPSIDYTANHSKFKYVLTARTTLTPDKEDALRDLQVELKDFTELSGLEINYDAIRRHNLESKLKDALAALDVEPDILEECFRPKVELKETFYDRLPEIVRQSLGPMNAEDIGTEKLRQALEERMLELLRILNPTQQVRNVDVIGMDAQDCFDLIYQTPIEPEEELS